MPKIVTLFHQIKKPFSTDPNNCILLGFQIAIYNAYHNDDIISNVPTFNTQSMVWLDNTRQSDWAGQNLS